MEESARLIIGIGSHAKLLSALTSLTMIAEEVIMDDLEAKFLIGRGDLENRMRLYYKFEDRLMSMVCQDASIWDESQLGLGCQIMTRAIVMPGAKLGCNVLLNTASQIDHDCEIGDHTIISPGVVICGGVKIGARCQIGAGAIVLENVHIRDGVNVPAGSLVVRSDDIRHSRTASDHFGQSTPGLSEAQRKKLI